MSMMHLDDLSSAVGSSTNINGNVKKIVSSRNTALIRPDSPRTIEACLELGLKIEDLQQKSYDDFSESGLTEEIIKLRYNHYLQRYNSLINEVIRKKKELTLPVVSSILKSILILVKYRKEKNINSQSNIDLAAKTLPATISTTNRNQISHRNMASVGGNMPTNNDTLSPRTINDTGAFLTGLLPSQYHYKETISLLRSSHDGPSSLRMQRSVDASDYSQDLNSKSMFDMKVSAEIEKFNKMKELKQREALEKYEEGLKRISSLELMYTKEKKRAEFEKKQKIDKETRRIENRKIVEEKLKKIKEAEEVYLFKKKEEERKIKKKLEETKRKLAEEAEERRKHQEELEEIKEKKRKEAEVRRKEMAQRESERLEDLHDSIERKIQEHSFKYEEVINDKIRRVKSDLANLDEKLQKTKELQQKNENESIQQVVEKLIHREETLLGIQKKLKKEFQEKQTMYLEKSKKLENNISRIEGDYQDRMDEIKDRLKKAEENLEHKREMEEKQIKLKQEERRLKRIDKLENFERNRRKMEYEQKKLLEKEKLIQEKLLIQKNEKEILQKIRIEAALQTKIERDRISQSVNAVTKILHVKDEADIKALKSSELQKSVKILKTIVKPEYLNKFPELKPIDPQTQGQVNQTNLTNSNAKLPLPTQKA